MANWKEVNRNIDSHHRLCDWCFAIAEKCAGDDDGFLWIIIQLDRIQNGNKKLQKHKHDSKHNYNEWLSELYLRCAAELIRANFFLPAMAHLVLFASLNNYSHLLNCKRSLGRTRFMSIEIRGFGQRNHFRIKRCGFLSPIQLQFWLNQMSGKWRGSNFLHSPSPYSNNNR